MIRFLVNRLLQAIPTILLVSIVVFLMLHLTPGDPAEIFIGDRQSTPEQLEVIREQMGLNRPLYVQYLDYMWHAVQGDLGNSLNNGRPVLDEILLRLPSTLELTLAAMLISTVLGIGLGIIAALNHNSFIDTAAMALALVGISMPVYWSSLLLIVLFSVELQWFPPIGQGSLDRLVMPAMALGFLSSGSLARLVRSSMLEVLSQDYMLTARAKGLQRYKVIFGHALRNALIPVVTILGLTFGELLGGAVLTETIFARLGIGRMYVTAVLNKDFTMVQGTTLFIACAYILINIMIDVIYVYVDPRIRYD
ncbi:ABC transporter permease [Phototrophicus methaneseepsis]|uniref:ABC transporter permease n=1 Tax=Phototrophicus methaneseepsis TaxID=2710758 RepID=A0A7S8EAC6_9CHLR|nr:ABC transporter permease [Phototrophicus methaneseepsis]QPC83274.1 ABC transporter permease [Phototrophicus methaneseepsis]